MPRGVPHAGFRRRRLEDGTLVNPDVKMSIEAAKNSQLQPAPSNIEKLFRVPQHPLIDNHEQFEVLESQNGNERVTEVRSSFIIAANKTPYSRENYGVEHVLSVDFNPQSTIKINNVSRFRKRTPYGNVIEMKVPESVREPVKA